MGNRSRDLRHPNFSDAVYGPLLGLLCNLSPCRPFIAAISCYSPNNHRLLRHLLRLSNHYCTTVTPIFSPQFDCSGISACSLGIGCLLGWSFITPLVLTLAPHDHVIYCQAQGLSGHTSPCGECVCFILEDSTPLEAKEEYLLHSWSDSKWAHFVHYEEIFDSELELLTPLWQAILGSRCSATGHTARRRFMLLGDRSCCSATVHTARRWFTLHGDRSCCSATVHAAWRRFTLLGS